MSSTAFRSTSASPAAIAAAVILILIVGVNLQYLLLHLPAYPALYDSFPFWVPEGGKSALQILLCLGTLAALRRINLPAILRELGFGEPPLPAILFGFAATLPLLLGLAASGTLVREMDWAKEAYTAGFGNIAEEVLFAGFAFGQLHRRARWPFWAAAGVAGAVFGYGHLDQGQDLASMAGLFVLTGGGLIAFAWLYRSWGYNLWVPLAMHGFMDLWWDLFALGDTALGGAFPFVLQISTLAAAVAITLRMRPADRRGSQRAAVEEGAAARQA